MPVETTPALHRPVIIGAVDQSDQARLVLERVGDEAVGHEAVEVHVLRVIDVPQRQAERTSLDDQHARLRAEAIEVLGAFHPSWRVHVHVRVGRPDEEIIALAHEARANAIVLGHHGEGGRGVRRRLFAGNTVERVLRVAPCPVLVVQEPTYDPPPADQCADCVQRRTESSGEVWFCDAHHDRTRPLHDVIVPGAFSVHSTGFGSGGLF